MTANPTPPPRPPRPLGLLDPTLAALTRALYEREMLIGQLGQQLETLTVERDALLTKGQGSEVKDEGSRVEGQGSGKDGAEGSRVEGHGSGKDAAATPSPDPRSLTSVPSNGTH